jgi:hypothetical protein
VIATLEPSYDDLGRLVDGDEIVAVNASVGDRGYWTHRLLRRAFSFVDVEGQLDAIDIRCMRGNSRHHSISEELTWNIPETWGACELYVTGTEGSTFVLYEYPKEPSHAPQ